MLSINENRRPCSQAQLGINKEDGRNLLLMHRTVEEALDRMQLMILPEDGRQFKVGSSQLVTVRCQQAVNNAHAHTQTCHQYL